MTYREPMKVGLVDPADPVADEIPVGAVVLLPEGVDPATFYGYGTWELVEN
jgi:hypothetical protein